MAEVPPFELVKLRVETFRSNRYTIAGEEINGIVAEFDIDVVRPKNQASSMNVKNILNEKNLTD